MILNKKLKDNGSKWFEKNVNKSSRFIYIPRHVFNKINLKKSDFISVEIKLGSNPIAYPTRVSKSTTRTGVSFSFNIPYRTKNLLNKKVFVRISKLEKIENYFIKFKENLIKIKSKNFIIINWLNKEYIIIWPKHTGYRTCDSILTPKILILNSKILSYLGLYMTDGNKKGSYKVFTSTKEIFKLAISCYHNIILNPSFKIDINYDKFNKDNRLNSKIVKEIKRYWKDTIPDIDSIKISINTRRKTAIKRSKSHVPFGSVFIRDTRTFSRSLHMFLINSILDRFRDNKDVLTHFFLGAALGDFYPSIRPRNKAFNWLEIATNKQEVFIWKNICKKLGFSYKEKIREGNRVLLCLHGYLNNIILLKKGLFLQYKKRRVKMIDGLKNRIETYILNKFRKSNKKMVEWEGEFLKKTNSFFIVNKGLDLVKKSLIKFDRKKVLITNEGMNFIKDLIKLNILEGG